MIVGFIEWRPIWVSSTKCSKSMVWPPQKTQNKPSSTSQHYLGKKWSENAYKENPSPNKYPQNKSGKLMSYQKDWGQLSTKLNWKREKRKQFQRLMQQSWSSRTKMKTGRQTLRDLQLVSVFIIVTFITCLWEKNISLLTKSRNKTNDLILVVNMTLFTI